MFNIPKFQFSIFDEAFSGTSKVTVRIFWGFFGKLFVNVQAQYLPAAILFFAIVIFPLLFSFFSVIVANKTIVAVLLKV